MNLLLACILTFPRPVGEPTPAPPPQQVVIAWERPYQNGIVVVVGYEGREEETRPWIHRWDAFAGVQEYEDYSWTIKRVERVSEIYRRALEREKHCWVATVCWPGEQVD